MSLNRMVQVVGNSFVFFRQFGAQRFTKECRYRLADLWNERRLGVQTGGLIKLPDIGILNEEFIEYAPIGYSAIYAAIRMVPLPASSVSFLDFGSGKGRAVISAATFPFKRVTGVEISAYLNDIAKENVARMRHRRAKHVELVQSDATEFAVADDTNVIYMANPFFGTTLEKVVVNILASYHARPRPLYIIYFNKIYFEKLIEHADYHMIKKRFLTHCYPNYSCGLYEITQADAAQSHETGVRGNSE